MIRFRIFIWWKWGSGGRKNGNYAIRVWTVQRPNSWCCLDLLNWCAPDLRCPLSGNNVPSPKCREDGQQSCPRSQWQRLIWPALQLQILIPISTWYHQWSSSHLRSWRAWALAFEYKNIKKNIQNTWKLHLNQICRDDLMHLCLAGIMERILGAVMTYVLM